MKITKQARAALFVMLLAISILPGCGKKKNDQPLIGGPAPGQILLPGQLPGTNAYAVSGPVQISQTGAFAGILSSAVGAVVPVGSSGAYTRRSSDSQVTVYFSGANGYYSTATAIVSVGPSMMQMCNMGYGYPGYAAPVMSIANVNLAPYGSNTVGPNGTLSMSVIVTFTNGCSVPI